MKVQKVYVAIGLAFCLLIAVFAIHKYLGKVPSQLISKIPKNIHVPHLLHVASSEQNAKPTNGGTTEGKGTQLTNTEGKGTDTGTKGSTQLTNTEGKGTDTGTKGGTQLTNTEGKGSDTESKSGTQLTDTKGKDTRLTDAGTKGSTQLTDTEGKGTQLTDTKGKGTRLTDAGTKGGTQLADAGSKGSTQLTDTGRKGGTQLTDSGRKGGTQLTDTGRKGSTQLTDTGSKGGTQLTDTGRKGGTQLTDTGRKGGTQLTDTGRKSSSQLTDTGRKGGKQLTDTKGRGSQSSQLPNTGRKATQSTEVVSEPAAPPIVNPKSLSESGTIDNYVLTRSVLSDVPLLGRTPERILLPVDLSDIHFSIKTASTFSERLQAVLLTWGQTVPIDQLSIITDKITNWTSAYIARGYHIYEARQCGLGHEIFPLCCKSGVEFDCYYRNVNAGKKYNWHCHIDDDQYYNVWKLKRMLTKYDPAQPWYIGKSHHSYTPMSYEQRRNFPEAKSHQWKFNTGNVYCLSRQMMIEVEKYLRGGSFPKSCDKTAWPDDVTVAIIIVGVLGHPPTEERQMWSHLELLDKLPPEESLKMISFGYGHLEAAHNGRWNTSLALPNPRFSYNQDPTRFLSYHCMMYPKVKWCQ